MKRILGDIVLCISLIIALNILVIMISTMQNRKETIQAIVQEKIQEQRIEKEGAC